MKSSSTRQSSLPAALITPRDILFECPKCGKGLVVDEHGQGLVVQCPQCSADVVVPPKPVVAIAPLPPYRAPTAAPAPPPPEPVRMELPPHITQIPTQHIEAAALQARLTTLSKRIKELQGQRTDIIAKMMGHIDEVNHALEQLGGLQGALNEASREWTRIVEEITTAKRTGEFSTTVNPAGTTGSSLPQR